MIRNFLQNQFLSCQASLGAWLTANVCDTYDAMGYDCLIQESLDRLSLDYDTYVQVPGFDYTNANQSQWTVLLSIQGRWTKVHLPNPLYEGSEPLTSEFAMVTRTV